MTPNEYLELLHQALTAPHGIALKLGNFEKAEQARSRLYRIRSALRRNGDPSFDGLSFYRGPVPIFLYAAVAFISA